MNEVLKVIDKRRSHRKYEDTPVTREQLDAILAAAVASPSAVNSQPWHFTVVRDQVLLDEINTELHRVMASKASASPRFADSNFHVFYRAPLVIFISITQVSPWSGIDCGIAAENIVLAAESLGLGSVILGLPREAFHGDKEDEFKKKLSFPEGYEFGIAVSIGIPADDKAAHPVKENLITYAD